MRRSEEAEQASTCSRGLGRGVKQCLATIRPDFGLNANVLAAVLDVDGRPVGVGQVEVAGHGILALRLQVSTGRHDAVTRADHDIQSRVQPRLPRLLDDAGQSEHGPGDVLVVVALDVLSVHSGRRGMAERYAGHRADLPALVLKLVEKGRHQAVIIGDVQAVVKRLHSTDQFRGAL